jgi:hypothetical protein
MKESVRPSAPGTGVEASSHAGKHTTTRFKLELLETFTAGQESRGYDPYNASGACQARDVWLNKPKRR